ncbi:MAG: hypothetical protein ACRDT8_07440 [Micromonosporaceae bacterium]
MLRITEWVVSGVALVAGIVLAGFAMFGMGLQLLWSGFGAQSESVRPWWMWLLFLAPPVLMAGVGFLARRAGASVPVALGSAGLIGCFVGATYLVVAYLTRS